MTSDAGPMIEVRGLRKAFGETVALGSVDLTVERGQIVALLGPNGAGKTTLVRILATLLRPDAGSARVAGHDVVGEGAIVRSLVGLTGQFTAVDDLLTGRENLELVGELCHLPRNVLRTRAAQLLEQFDLEEAAGRLVRTYSGGMRRRLDLAMSLISEPPVVFLDEPTTGLDPPTRVDLWETIARRADAGVSILLTTQYLEEADRLASRIVVLDRGAVVAQGTADALKDRLGRNVVELRTPDLASLERAAAVLGGLAGDGLTLDHERRLLTVLAAEGPATLAAVLARLLQAGVPLDDIGLRRPSLDDVFLALTGHAPAAPEEDAQPKGGRRP